MVVVLVCWQLSTALGIVDVNFSSNPVRTFNAGVELFSTGAMWKPLGVTGYELLWGLGITFLAGIPIGLVLGRSRVLFDMTEPIVNVLYSVPYVMFLPIIIFWFGLENTSRVIVIVWAAILPLIINITAGVRNLNNDYSRVATVFCTPKLKFFYAIALPATLPYILAGVRLAVGRGLVGAIVAELFLASEGLGYFVQTQTANFNIDSAMAGIVLLAAIALLLNGAVRLIERRFVHWAGAQ
ncbi:ABC transporter permease [Kibdelosporangium philippinense]|uniref:ABC transporter permease n=2 Tax=Kibdelosporangium philippinense TaxID=211113 RepID=A0ABS8Z2J1_9PSEU|nr:ABC transporter permease [Kibdelosporangium philippinense]MCE7002060.1 ABC transporter permease [Kibdelosporangium philippinense]